VHQAGGGPVRNVSVSWRIRVQLPTDNVTKLVDELQIVAGLEV